MVFVKLQLSNKNLKNCGKKEQFAGSGLCSLYGFYKIAFVYFGAPGKWSLLIKSGLQSNCWQKETFSVDFN